MGIAFCLIGGTVARADTPPTYFGRWGGPGTDHGQFTNPRGVAVDPLGFVYVADYNNQRIQKFDALGSFVTAWGSFGSDTSHFIGPWDVAVSKAGNVYTIETSQARVQEFTKDGLFIRKWGTTGTGAGQFQTPIGIAISSNGAVYVGERTGLRIQEFDLNGDFIRTLGSAGTGDGQFQALFDVAVGNDGNVYATDIFCDCVQKFDSTGTFLAKWDWSAIGTPSSVAVDTQGNLLVTDSANNRVVKLDTSGNVLTTFGSPGNGPGQFMAVERVEVAPSGYIYVTDSQLDFVSLFVPPDVDAGPPGIGSFAVYGSVPQPITSRGAIRFQLPATARVSVGIYDVSGRLVRQLSKDAVYGAGVHELPWDRRDDKDRRVVAGVYQVLVRSASYSGTKKLVVVD
jgi:streptogramin lyase